MFSLWTTKPKGRTINDIRRERHLIWLKEKNAKIIQNWWRELLIKKTKLYNIIKIQCMWRCFLAKRDVQIERDALNDIAAIVIQTTWRKKRAYDKYRSILRLITKTQSIARMYLARRAYILKRNRAIMVQSILRRRVINNRYRGLLNLHRNNRVRRNIAWQEITTQEDDIIATNNQRMLEINTRIEEIRRNTYARMNELRGQQTTINHPSITHIPPPPISPIQHRLTSPILRRPISPIHRTNFARTPTPRPTFPPVLRPALTPQPNTNNGGPDINMIPYNRNIHSLPPPIRPVLADTLIERNRQNMAMLERARNIGITRGQTSSTCCICMETYMREALTMTCNHKVCSVCMRDYIISCMGDMMHKIPIKCPMSHDGCNVIIDQNTPGINRMLSTVELDKLEKFTIMKTCIEDQFLKYCPNESCGSPFDATYILNDSRMEYKYKYCVRCFECNIEFCVKCNTVWHDGRTCEEQMEYMESNETQNINYINTYCKKCPRCKEGVQKQKSQEQGEYERRSGMNGGTYDCHHMECSKCKYNFCWTCMEGYGREYYHHTCPNSDCIIHFINHSPMIQGLPHGKIDYIYMFIDNNAKVMLFSPLNRNSVLAHTISHYGENVVRLYCSRDGIVTKLEHNVGEFTFRQESRGKFDNIL